MRPATAKTKSDQVPQGRRKEEEEKGQPRTARKVPTKSRHVPVNMPPTIAQTPVRKCINDLK